MRSDLFYFSSAITLFFFSGPTSLYTWFSTKILSNHLWPCDNLIWGWPFLSGAQWLKHPKTTVEASVFVILEMPLPWSHMINSKPVYSLTCSNSNNNKVNCWCCDNKKAAGWTSGQNLYMKHISVATWAKIFQE